MLGGSLILAVILGNFVMVASPNCVLRNGYRFFLEAFGWLPLIYGASRWPAQTQTSIR